MRTDAGEERKTRLQSLTLVTPEAEANPTPNPNPNPDPNPNPNPNPNQARACGPSQTTWPPCSLLRVSSKVVSSKQ